jgi:hypothetical protein
MPYDDKGNWTPDPEDEIYTDPDESKYVDEEGNDYRFGYKYKDLQFIPDHPDIIKMKKSGKWAKMGPIQRRWALHDYYRPSARASADLKRMKEENKRIRKEL